MALVNVPKSIAFFETTLASSISKVATSFTLTSATDKDGNTLTDDTYAFVIDEGNANEEIVVVRCNGTAVTEALRGVSVKTGNTEVTALKKSHRRGASVKNTDAPIIPIVANIMRGEGELDFAPSSGGSIVTKDYADAIASAGAPDASTSTKGIAKLSTAPASATNPIAVGDNDTRLPSVDVAAALAGDGGTPSSTNPFTLKSRTKTAGATINGATLPVPVYQNTSDNEFYACDADDTSAMKYIGFAISNGTDGNDIEVQFDGVVSGFTGLSEGEKYYVQDTAGTIGTTIGTYEILVGVAISETELLIQKGKRHSAGYGTFTASGTSAITLGFRPSKITAFAFSLSDPRIFTRGTWTNGVYATAGIADATGGGSFGSISSTSKIWDVRSDTSDADIQSGTITSVTDTGFTFTNTESAVPHDIGYVWEAEGEL